MSGFYLEQEAVGECVITAIHQIQQLYPDEAVWTTNVSCETSEPVDYRITRLLYIPDKKVGWLDIEMY